MLKGIEVEEWDRLYYKYVEMHMAVNIRTPSNNRKANALWMLRKAEGGWGSILRSSERLIESRDAVRQALCV